MEKLGAHHPHVLVGGDALGLLDELSHLPWPHIRTLALSVAGQDEIDATGVAALVRVYSHLERAHRGLCLCHVSPALRRRLDLFGLEELLPVCEDPPAGAYVEPWDLETSTSIPPRQAPPCPE